MTAEPLAYLNGELLPYSKATLALHNAGFVLGATVTDFCRTFRRRLFRRPDHLARFRRDCASCSIPLLHSDEQLTAIADELIERNARLAGADAELALITFATPGEIGYFIGQPGGAGDLPPTVGMHTIVLDRRRYRRFFEDGIDLYAVAQEDPFPLVRVKHRSRLNWWLADRAIRNRPDCPAGAVPILAHPRIGLLDTAIGSFLLVREGIVCVPHSEGILDSISLRVVKELCDSLNIPLTEMDLTPESSATAQEAMLTGTAFCLAAVRSIRGGVHPPTIFQPSGPIFHRLLTAFSDRVGVDIRADFLRFP